MSLALNFIFYFIRFFIQFIYQTSVPLTFFLKIQ